MNEILLEGSEMKTGRILVLLALVMGLMAGPWQAPAGAEMLGRVGQFKNLFYDNSDGKWYQTNPDGTLSIFTLAAGQAYVMTQISVRFYSVCRKFFPQRGVNGHYTNRSREQVL